MSIRDVLALAARPHGTLAAAKPPTTERGSSGGPSFGGNRHHGEEVDVNALWRPPQRYATVRKMRAHPDTNAAMDAIILALLSRDLEVVPASEDPEDVAIAEFIENDLHHLSDKSLFDLRFEALDGALWDGCTPYQTVYSLGQDDGRYHLRKLALRPPSTVARWPTDDHGGPAGMVQLDDMGAEVAFDMEELLVFVHRRRGGDLTGTPLSRRMYAPWYVLDLMYKLAPAVYERNGMRIPVGRAQAGQEDRMDEMLMGLRAGALAFARLTDDMSMDDLKLLGGEGQVVDGMPLMEYMRRAIFLSTFTQGQVLGSDGVGSLALSETHMDLLMVMLRAIGQMETDTYNRYLIPRWVGFNWAGIPESRLPKVAAAQPDARDVQGFFDALLKGTQAGIVWEPEAVRQRAHEELGVPLPEVVETTQDDGGGEGDDAPAAQAGRRTFASATVAKPEPLRSQIALDALGIKPNWSRMAGAYEEAEQRILKAATTVQRRQIANLLNRAREIVAKRDPALVASTEVRFADELEAQLLEVLAELYEDGQTEMTDELEQQGVKAPPVPEKQETVDRGMIAAMAAVTAGLLADRMRRAWSAETLRQVRLGEFSKEDMSDILLGLSDNAILDAARQDTTVAVGIGRRAVGYSVADFLDHYINSEVLDPNTCGPCREVDGVEVALEDVAQYQPYRDCEGRDRCRGVLVPVVKKEAAA